MTDAEHASGCVLSRVLKVLGDHHGWSPAEFAASEPLLCVALEQAIRAGLRDHEHGERPTPVEPLPAYRSPPRGAFGGE